MALFLALLVLCDSAASAVLVIGPAGAATQAPPRLLAAGVAEPCAISLVLTVQLLAIFAGGLVVMTAASHQAGRRLFTYLP